MTQLLGGLTYDEILEQMSDGFSCFMGRNPHDHIYDECGSAATMLIAYIAVNFIYNILLLAITKRGSAMLLVISQVMMIKRNILLVSYYQPNTKYCYVLTTTGIITTNYKYCIQLEGIDGPICRACEYC